MKLYRPCGPDELRLVFESGMRAWPPRLAEQPIFYPVLNRAYATQIARDWNANSTAQAGYVTLFEITDKFASAFPRQVVGGREHEELWVPAERLDELNANLCGRIALIGAVFGPRFTGINGTSALDRLKGFAAALGSSQASLDAAVAADAATLYLEFPFLAANSPVASLLKAIEQAWHRVHPEIPLHR